MDGLLSDIGVLLSRLLQHGDSIEELASGTGKLGDGGAPSSIIGAALDRVAAELRENAGDESPPAKEPR